MSPLESFNDVIGRHVGAAISSSLIHTAARAGRFLPIADLDAQGIRVTRDVIYRDGGGPDQSLDVYRPPGEGPFPAVLYLHGGGFRILSKETHWVMGAMFARAGYVVFNANYRLTGVAPYPAALEDCADAYRFVLSEGARYGADLSRVIVAGESAGANLTLALGLALCDLESARTHRFSEALHHECRVPDALLPACGVLQVSDLARFGRRYPQLRPIVRSRMDAISEGYLGDLSRLPPGSPDLALADPLVTLEARQREGRALDRPLPPTFAIVGTRDPLLDDTRRLAAAVPQAQASYYPGGIHAFHAMVWRARARRSWADTFEFLATCD